MPFRALLIRIMLWSLGATAVVGAMTVLVVGMGEMGWRLIGTGVATAVAAGLLIPFSALADKPKTRRVGLLGMVWVVIEFAGTIGLIWEVFDLMGSPFDERIGLTMVFLGLTALPAILFLWLSSKPEAKVAGPVGTALSAVVFALFMIAVWHPDRIFIFNDDWLGIVASVAGFGVLAVGSLAGVGVTPRRVWRWAGVVASIIGCTLAIYAICVDIHSGSTIFAAIVSIAGVVPHANLCMLVPLAGAQKWVRVVTIAGAIVTAVIIDLLVLASNNNTQFPLGENLAGAAGIITACGTLALGVLARLNRNLDRVPVLSEIKQIAVVCPGCQRKQTLNVGSSTCPHCGLLFDIRLEEPRCPSCDYLLFMLQSDRCPECGTLVRGATTGQPPAGASRGLP